MLLISKNEKKNYSRGHERTSEQPHHTPRREISWNFPNKSIASKGGFVKHVAMIGLVTDIDIFFNSRDLLPSAVPRVQKRCVDLTACKARVNKKIIDIYVCLFVCLFICLS